MSDAIRVSSVPSGAAILVSWPGEEEIFYSDDSDLPTISAGAAQLVEELVGQLDLPVVFDSAVSEERIREGGDG